MRRSPRRCAAIVVAAAAFTLVLAQAAAAHVTKLVGPVRLTYGWGEEPAYTGAPNFVQVRLADAAGRPVLQPGGALTAEVSFGGARMQVPLLPSQQAGEYRGTLVPTRPGTYGMRITGSVRGRQVDTAATCSEQTFACVD